MLCTSPRHLSRYTLLDMHVAVHICVSMYIFIHMLEYVPSQMPSQMSGCMSGHMSGHMSGKQKKAIFRSEVNPTSDPTQVTIIT